MWLSVIIAAYNAETTLQAALDSVFVQPRAGVEVIIVDDGSRDSTGSIAERAAESHDDVRVVRKPNGGTASALNAALAVATGEFVSRLDADDEFDEEYFDTVRRCIDEHPGFDIYAHDLWRIEPNGHTQRLYGWTDVRSFSLEDMFDRNVISGPSTLVRREVVERVGGFREGLFNEDYDLWLRVLAAGARHIYCPVTLYRYRFGFAGQKTSDLVGQFESDIRILEDLISGGELGEGQIEAAKRAIAGRRELIRNEPARVAMVKQAERFQLAVERRIGPRFAGPALSVIHLVSWTTRPLRRFLLRRRAGRL